MYHAENPPVVIFERQIERYKNEGWEKTPHSFFNIKEAGFDPNVNSAVQAVGESIQGVADYLNGLLNLHLMTKTQLKEFALRHLDLNFTSRTLKKHMVAKIREETNVNSAKYN